MCILDFEFQTTPLLASKPSLQGTRDARSMYEIEWTASLRELAEPDLYRIRRCSIFPVLLWEPFARSGRCWQTWITRDIRKYTSENMLRITQRKLYVAQQLFLKLFYAISIHKNYRFYNFIKFQIFIYKLHIKSIIVSLQMWQEHVCI